MLISLVTIGGVFLAGPDAYPQHHPVLTQYERQLRAASRPNPRCKPTPYETPITYSQLTVFDSREVAYQISTMSPCLGQVAEPPWGLRWEAPNGTMAIFRYRLSVQEFERLKAFLDRADVKGINSFLNAGPGVGDFKIAIARPSGTQNVDVLSLMPEHMELVKSPVLVHLVCKVKDIARIASGSNELPDWCRNIRPLTAEMPPSSR